MKKFIFFFLITVIASACGKSGNTLKGTFNNGGGQTVYLERFEKSKPIIVDSAVIEDNGNFTLQFPNQLDIYRLRIHENDFAVLILDSSNTPEIKAEAGQVLATYSVNGSKNSELVHEFFKKTNEYLVQREEFRKRLDVIALDDSIGRAAVLGEIEVAKTEFDNYKKAFVNENPASPALITTMNQFHPLEEIEYLKKIEAALAASMPNSEYHQSLKLTVQQSEMQAQMMEMEKQQAELTANLLKTGTPAPEIDLPGIDGNNIKLSSLRGKYVLIDFWASWCVPCRNENPNVVRLYEKYKDKGFEVYSVSLDDKKDKWINAINKDGLIWKSHVSELKQWQSAVVSTYGIQSIPFTVLLDKKGNVLATNLRGTQLEDKLKELLGV